MMNSFFLIIASITYAYYLFILIYLSYQFAAINITGWISYPLHFLLGFFPLFLLKFYSSKKRSLQLGNYFGVFITAGILCVLIIHWVDRSLYTQLKFKERKLETFINSQQENTYCNIKIDTLWYSKMLMNIRYNLDGDKEYTGAFLIPFNAPENKNCLIWIYEYDYFGRKRKSDLLHFLKNFLGGDTTIAFTYCKQPPLSWLDFKQTSPITKELGFTKSLIVKRYDPFFTNSTLLTIKHYVIYILTLVYVILLILFLVKGKKL